MSGMELVKHLQSRVPDMQILVVSRHDETLYAERCIRAGTRGYVMKQEAGDDIVKAIRKIFNGRIFVSEEINDRLLQGMAEGGRERAMQSPLEVLSNRELEVSEPTGQGNSTREIAERLHLSVKTVESYRARIKKKLNFDSANEFMQHAVQWVESEESPQSRLGIDVRDRRCFSTSRSDDARRSNPPERKTTLLVLRRSQAELARPLSRC